MLLDLQIGAIVDDRRPERQITFLVGISDFQLLKCLWKGSIVDEHSLTDEEGLDEDGDDHKGEGNPKLYLHILSKDEDEEHVEGEEVGVNLEEVVLDGIVYDLHAVVVVDGVLVLVEKEEEQTKYDNCDGGHLEGEEDDEREGLEQDDELELEGETGVLYLLM